MVPWIEPPVGKYDSPLVDRWGIIIPLVGIITVVLTGILIGGSIVLENDSHHDVLVTVMDKEIVPHARTSEYYLVGETKDYYRVDNVAELNRFDIGQQYVLTINYKNEVKSWRKQS